MESVPWALIPLLLLGLLQPCASEGLWQRCDSATDGTIYDYEARTLNGSHTVSLQSYRGRAVLFVNVATY